MSGAAKTPLTETLAAADAAIQEEHQQQDGTGGDLALHEPVPDAEPEPLQTDLGPTVHGRHTSRSQAFYNELDMKRVAASDFIRDIDRKMELEREQLSITIERMRRQLEETISELQEQHMDRERGQMDRRDDALNEVEAVETTMRALVGRKT